MEFDDDGNEVPHARESDAVAASLWIANEWVMFPQAEQMSTPVELTMNLILGNTVRIPGVGNWATRAPTAGGQNPLPVELTRFDASVDGRAVILNWETATETNNAGFAVEQRVTQAADDPSGTWIETGWVEGAGSTLEARSYQFTISDLGPGPYAFRLKQIDFDGTLHYSPITEVFVDLPGTHILSSAYPNPFNPQSRFTLMVATEQQVRVQLFDALGRLVQTLHEGLLSEYIVHSFRIQADNLPTGLYLYRATGETFDATQRVILIR